MLEEFDSRLRIHAIVRALNEAVFIENQLRTLYPFCSGISIVTQFDRDWYGAMVGPDGIGTISTADAAADLVDSRPPPQL